MRRVRRYLLRTIAIVVVLLLLIPAVFYIPAVQRYIKSVAVNYVTTRMGMYAEIGSFTVKFPFDLALDNVLLGRTQGDTMVYVEKMSLDVWVWRLLSKELSVERLSVEGAVLHIVNDSTGLELRTKVDSLFLRADVIDLVGKRVVADRLWVSGGDVFLKQGKSGAVDTATGMVSFDWTFVVKDMAFRDVGFVMKSVSMPLLTAGGPWGRVVNAEVSVGQQYVTVDSVRMEGGGCRILLGESQETVSVKDTTAPSLWTVRAGSVQMDGGVFYMSSENGGLMDINLSGIGVQVDSVYNRGTVVKGKLKHLQALQKDGVELRNMYAMVDLDTVSVEVAGARIRTANSVLDLTVGAEASLSGMMKSAPLTVRVKGEVGMEDVGYFVTQIPAGIRSKRVNLDGAFALWRDRVDVSRMEVGMPGCFQVAMEGYVSSFGKLTEVSGDVSVKGVFTDMAFVNEMMGKDFVIPRDLKLRAKVKADRGKMMPDIRLEQGDGWLTVAGKYAMTGPVYDLKVEAEGLRLDRFMPLMGLGDFTGEVTAAGHGLKWGRAVADVVLAVRRLGYKGHEYEDVRLEAGMKGGRVEGRLTSGDKDLLVDLTFSGDSAARRYVAELSGKIASADLFALNLVDRPLTIATDMSVKAAVGARDSYLLHAELEGVRVDDGSGFNNLGNLMFHLDSDVKETSVDLVSGDFKLAFTGDTVVQPLIKNFANGFKVAAEAVKDGRIDMESIQQQLPRFQLSVESAGDNLLGKYLESQGIRFKEVRMQAILTEKEGLQLHALVKYPNMGKIEPDSLWIEVVQRDKRLDYSLEVMNSTGNLQDLYKLRAYGNIQQNRMSLGLKQQNKEGEIGVDFGLNVTLADSAVSVSVFPMTPILGYSRWIVNAGNRVVFYRNRKVEADLSLSYQDKLIRVRSIGDEGEQRERLKVEIKGIDLAAVSAASPFIPDMGGVLSSDMLFYSTDDRIVADGQLGIREFYYGGRRLGTMLLNMNYALDSSYREHAVDFVLHLDSVKRALVKGRILTPALGTADKGVLDVKVEIPSLPLYVANAFMPEGLVDLKGELTGGVQVTGTLDRPRISGALAFKKGMAEVLPLGTTFGIDSSRIVIKDSKMRFHRYGLVAPNRQLLTIDGELSMANLSDVRADLKLKTTNFQLVDVKQNSHSLVYGKAFVSLDATVAGPVNGLRLTGNVSLLNNTVLDYVMRSSGPRLRDRSVDLVRFVSFGDTTLAQKDELTNRVNLNNFNMKMLVEIGNTVRMNVNLSDDGENRVEIQGGGNLIYSMNDEGRNSLMGKYTLTGGTVRYSVPVVGVKNFTIQNGSYVEWTGELMNPKLNITAGESIKASVSEDNQSSRLVMFDAMIRIQNTLQQPGVTFDLSAPNDQTIQNQLATFSPEERTKEAMGLLIYGTYSGPGAVSTSNTAGNTLNGFIEKELNQWTRKYLKNSGLSFGVDTYNEYGTGGQEVQKTDYSYQFSKQFFNDRVNVKIGGRISTDNEPGSNSNMEQNLVDDVTVEYVFDKNRSLFLKVFRNTNYESVLDGEVTQTGAGIVWRKNFRKVKDLFIRKDKRKVADVVPVVEDK